MAPLATVRLFVYGSLKRSGRHHEELRGARFLAEVRTTPGFELVTLTLGADDYQALVAAPGAATSVSGELFEVPAAHLPRLDDFEGEAYERREVPLSSDVESAALAYFRKSR